MLDRYIPHDWEAFDKNREKKERGIQIENDDDWIIYSNNILLSHSGVLPLDN